MNILFDTHAEIERLRESGITEAQARAITLTVRNGVTGGVATKADLIELKAELKGDVAGLKADMAGVKGNTGRLETEVNWGRLETKVNWLKWVCGVILGTCGAILVAVLGVLAKLLFFP